MQLLFKTLRIIAISSGFGLFLTPVNGQQSSTLPSSTPQSSTPNLAKFAAPPTSSKKSFNHSRVALLNGGYKDGVWQVGVEINMAKGWKTYWLVPGDAGVPPEFVWKNSRNVANANVSFPAPKRYEDVTGKSIGYKGQVIFPVKIKPKNNDQSVKLDLRLYYAACSDICVPAQANIGLELSQQTSEPNDLAQISYFNNLVPKPNETRINVQKTELLNVNGKPNLAISLTGKLANKTDILVEGFEDAYFGEPVSSGASGNVKVFLIPIEGLEKDGSLSGKKLKLTVLSGDIRLASEVVVK